MTRFDETWHRLLDWTQGQAPSERLSTLLLNEEVYDVIDPSHRLGGKDKGADATGSKDGSSWQLARRGTIVLMVSFSQKRDLLRDKEKQQVQVNVKSNPVQNGF